jgi:hypothetical protein
MQMMPNASCDQRVPLDVAMSTPTVLDVTTMDLKGKYFVYQ